MSGQRCFPRLLVAALAAALLTAPGAAAAPAGWLDPFDVQVGGGATNWHPEPRFLVTWHRALSAEQPPFPSAIDYVVRTADDTQAGPVERVPWHEDHLKKLPVPATPGRYTVELWLEGEASTGAHASTRLLFDDARPGPPRVLTPPTWIGARSDPALRVQPPAGSTPLSGIAGYAASADRGEGSAPCAGTDRCSATEIDARASGGVDAVPLGALADGTDFVRLVAVSGSGMRSGSPTTVVVHVDRTAPAIALDGGPRGWARGPVRLAASAVDRLSGMTPAGADGPSTTIGVDGGAAAISRGDRAETTVAGDGVHRVSYCGRDAAGNLGCGEETVRIDQTAPSVSFDRAQDPAEPERILATVVDDLSGPDTGRGSIAVRRAGSAEPFTPLPTSSDGGRLSAAWDSDSFPPGSYEFRATAYDRAGNATAADRRADGARMVLAAPLKAPTRLRFGFGARRLVWHRCARVRTGRRCRRQVIVDYDSRPAKRVAGYGHGILVGGRLTRTSGARLEGLPVRLVESFDRGSTKPTRTTVVTTGADGSFSARLAPGPSRRVEAFFPGTRVLSRTSGRSLRLGVLASVRLRASSAQAKIGGRPVVFSGRVASESARIPATGRPVQLQFRIPGGSWSEFRTVQTDARGRFRYAYAFTDDDSRGVRFQFRAYAPAAEGQPYEPAASRPVFVTGQ